MALLRTLSLYLLLVSASFSLAVPAATPKYSNNNHAQFVHEKEEPKPDSSANDENDDFHLTNDYKPDPPPFASWNPYSMTENNAAAAAGRYMGFYGYPNPIIIPYPVFVSQDPYYPYQDFDDYEDMMSRASTRRGSNYRNSPIYYLRLPPTPYMFIPGLGYHSQPPTFTPSFSPLLPYNPIQALPVPPAINPFINLPVPFISNGKPTGIYQLDSNPQPQQYQPFAPPPPPIPSRPYRPPTFTPPPSQGYVPSDSKISQLKRPYLFNGRPEQIYLLQSGFNPMYQSPIPGYY